MAFKETWSEEKELDVISRCKEGDNDAMKELYEHYKGFIAKIIKSSIIYKSYPDIAMSCANGAFYNAVMRHNYNRKIRLNSILAFNLRSALRREVSVHLERIPRNRQCFDYFNNKKICADLFPKEESEDIVFKHFLHSDEGLSENEHDDKKKDNDTAHHDELNSIDTEDAEEEDDEFVYRPKVVPIDFIEDVAESQQITEDDIYMIEIVNKFFQVLDSMKASHREILYDIIVKGRSQTEIARERGVSDSAISQQKNLALDILKGQLAGFDLKSF